MTEHYKLVEYFCNNLINDSKIKLSDIISPRFVFSSIEDGNNDFNFYSKNIVNAQNSRKFKAIKIISLDDVNFLITFSIMAQNSIVSEYGVALIVIKNKKIERVEFGQKKVA